MTTVEQERRAKLAARLPLLMLFADSSRTHRVTGKFFLRWRGKRLSQTPSFKAELTLRPVLESVDGGVNAVRLRVSQKELAIAVGAAQQLQSRRPVPLIFVRTELVSSSAGLARELETGVHLPERPESGFSQPQNIETVRTQAGGHDIVVSRAVHSLEAAERAEAEGADMLVLGTVFPSPSHPGGPTIGIEGVREVCERVHIPVIGIGGITAQNAGDVIRAGASGVAVISAIFDAADPRAAAAELRAAIDAAWAERKVT